jgi:hypothetical protein
MGGAFKTACTRIEGRPIGPLLADRGSNLLPTPRLDLSAAPRGKGCGGMNRDQHSLNAAVAMERVIDY